MEMYTRGSVTTTTEARSSRRRTSSAYASLPNIQVRSVDLLVLVVCTLVIIFSVQYDSQLRIEERWYQPIDSSSFSSVSSISNSYYANEHFPKESEKLPKPLITDLDGDGFNEIVFVTTEYTIKVADTSSSTVVNPNTATLELPTKAESSLLPVIKVNSGRKPIALASGYLTPYKSGEIRQQYIVVITDGWTVLCFSNALKLIWETNVQDFVPENMYHSEVSAVVVPHSIFVGDKGSVIVGGKLSLESNQPNIGHEHGSLNDSETVSGNSLDAEEEMIDHSTQHFSYYAFDGRTGALRWKHDSGDFTGISGHSGEVDEEEVMPEHSYKLHVLNGAVKHLGEVDWRQYREDVLRQLPHYWKRREDTVFEIDKFKRKVQTGGKNPESEWTAQDLGIPSSHIAGLPFGGMAPHVPSDHVANPNVMIAHGREGIEVVHLYTGRTLCRMTLIDGMFADVNGDGIIDRIQTFVGPDLSARTHNQFSTKQHLCYATVTTGIPVMEQLFNVSLCGMPSSFLSSFWSTASGDYDKDDTHLEAANPVVIKSVGTVFSDKSGRELDTIFLVSSGKMTSVRSNGRINWQTDTPAFWTRKSTQSKSTDPSSLDPHQAILPSLSLFPVDPFGDKYILLAVGNSIALVAVGGAVFATSDTLKDSQVPISAPTIGDFNNDGISDIVLTTATGYYGFAVVSRSSNLGVFIPSMIITVLIVAGIVTFINSRKTQIPQTGDNRPSSERERRKDT